MNYLIAGMIAGAACIVVAELMWAQFFKKGEQGTMIDAMLFMIGFSSVVSVYEIAKTTKSTKSDAIRREAEKIGRKRK